ncbi:response regulator [Mucilaginibacter sp. dw_454]|uniref:response regulator n=1 Tax=Mucilaginibacter sp. dw_454 TaxID=2720079 RepID=UPI001BD489E5|nr:response regulator [Mucilaginibacter sp. dw_454]
MELSFIIIDDTELDHFIARKMIGNVNAAYTVKSFMDAGLALQHIISHKHDSAIKVVLVFLDIHMPMMNGFEFVEAFEKLEQAIQDKYYIVALTSSIEVSDINRIASYSSFRTRITKPITADGLKSLLNTVAAEFGISLT